MMLMSAEKMKKMRRILLLLITRTLSEVVHLQYLIPNRIECLLLYYANAVDINIVIISSNSMHSRWLNAI